MRRLPSALTLALATAVTATAGLADDTTSSSLIAARGPSAAAAALAEAPASPDRDLALAAARFLAGIEGAYQARWRIGATKPVLPLPILGTPLPPNPDPRPMQPDFLNGLAADLDRAMALSRAALPKGPAAAAGGGDGGGDGAALVLRLPDLWLDVDGDGRRGPSEGLLDLIGIPVPEAVQPEIRFDAADADWLRAYTHLLQALSRLTLAFDPAPALAQRIALDAELARQFAAPPGELAREPSLDHFAETFGPMVDYAAVILQTLRNTPDAADIAEAAGHLRQMIAANRDFWAAVATETDNDREWIPNDGQQAALGFALPPGTGRRWLAILSDAEQVLEGRMLVPFWRFAPGYGIDLSAWLKEPAPVDVISWIQGSAALPYARPGLTVGRENWDRFLTMFPGRAGLYMVLFN